MEELKDFVINEYKQAEKTIHVDYGNLIVMTAKLENGYIVVEHCICMNPMEFDIEKGRELCESKIIKRLLEIYHPVEIKNPNNLTRFKLRSE